jgi:hypothetical protein
MKKFTDKYFRPWATPIVIGSYFLMMITGILMFFHLDVGINKIIHEWFGWFLIIGGIAHLLMHLNSLIKYLKKPISVSLIAIFIIVLVTSFFIEKRSTNPVKNVMMAVNKAPISSLIAISGNSEIEVLENLKSNGFIITNNQENVDSIANGDKEKTKKLISLIFKKD